MRATKPDFLIPNLHYCVPMSGRIVIHNKSGKTMKLHAGFTFSPICNLNFSLFAASFPARSASSWFNIESSIVTEKHIVNRILSLREG